MNAMEEPNNTEITGKDNPGFSTSDDPEINLRKRSIQSEVQELNSVSEEKVIQTKPKKEKDKYLWRDLVAYWFLGLTNNYGYVVMLTAAHDIIKEITGASDHIRTIHSVV